MQSRCEECRFLRRFRPMSQLLAQDLGTADQPLVSELLKIMQEERQQRDAEAELKSKLFENRDVSWPYRPRLSDYCGCEEDNGRYLVHELKNRDGCCADWQRGETKARGCGDCRHQRRGEGGARDERKLAELAQLAANAAALSLGSQDQATNYRQLAGTRKAFEAAQAFYAGRVTGNPPEYLSTCAKNSTPGNVMPCVVQNPNSTCGDWSADTQAMTAPASGRPSLTDALRKFPARPPHP